MPLRKRRLRSDRRRARVVSTAPLRIAYELGAIAAEALLIPLRAWLRLAAVAGAAVLAVWRVVLPASVAAARGARRLLAAAARAITPARTALAVALFAAAALAASQFVDYRAVQIGAPQYRHLSGVAPPPQVDAATATTPHGLWVLAIDAAAIGVIGVAAASGRWRYARLLVPLGAAVVVIAIAVDAPEGLKTGQAGLAYQGARATLLEGYGAEIAAASVLAFSGLLVAAYAPARAPRRSRRGLGGRRTAVERVRTATPRRASG